MTADTPAGRAFAAVRPRLDHGVPAGLGLRRERDRDRRGHPHRPAGVTVGGRAARPGPRSADPCSRIGDRCVIGRGSHIVAHESVEIGDDVWTGPYVYITDQNHGYEDPDAPIGTAVPGATARSASARARGSARARSCCPAPASAATWWSRRARWSAAQVPDHCVVAGVPAQDRPRAHQGGLAAVPRRQARACGHPRPARPPAPSEPASTSRLLAQAEPVQALAKQRDAAVEPRQRARRARQPRRGRGQAVPAARRRPAPRAARKAPRRPPRPRPAGAAARTARAAAGPSGTGRRRPRPWRAAPTGRTAWRCSRPRPPRTRGRRSSGSAPAAVRKMIGTSGVRPRRLICAAVSKPSMPGMSTSSRMTANSSPSAASRAASPDRTATSSWSSDDRIASSASRFSARSSTSRIFARCATSGRASGDPAVATGARGAGHVVVLPVAILTCKSFTLTRELPPQQPRQLRRPAASISRQRRRTGWRRTSTRPG